MRTSRLILIAILASLSGSAAFAGPNSGSGVGADSHTFSNLELDQRIEWLQTTLEAGRLHSKLWHYG